MCKKTSTFFCIIKTLMFISQCHLLGTDLEDILTVWLDSVGEPVSVSQVSPGPCSLDRPTTSMWTTNVQIKYPDGGPVPDTASYISKLEREKEARDRGETKDNRSFLAKYVRYHSISNNSSKIFPIFTELKHCIHSIFAVDVHRSRFDIRRPDVGGESRTRRSRRGRGRRKQCSETIIF